MAQSQSTNQPVNQLTKKDQTYFLRRDYQIEQRERDKSRAKFGMCKRLRGRCFLSKLGQSLGKLFFSTFQMKILIINGPNLNLLGRREPEIYGRQTFEEFFEKLKLAFPQAELHYFQSNHEGVLLDFLHAEGFAADGIVINAGALTHTSIALADALAAVAAPAVEVHISNVHRREDFRHHSFLSAKCVGSIVGLGLEGYRLAVQFFLNQAKNS